MECAMSFYSTVAKWHSGTVAVSMWVRLCKAIQGLSFVAWIVAENMGSVGCPLNCQEKAVKWIKLIRIEMFHD